MRVPMFRPLLATAITLAALAALPAVLLAIPAAPTITQAPPAVTNQRNLTVKCDGALNATYSWVLNAQAAVGAKTCEYALNGLPDGVYALKVTQTVPLQGTSPAATVNFTVDGTVPAPPKFATTPALIANDPAPAFTWTPAEPGGTFQWRILRDAVVVQGPMSTPAAQAKAAPLVDGTYAIQVTQTDAAGNVSIPLVSPAFVVDATAPSALQLVTPIPTAGSAVPKPVLTGTESNLAVAWSLTGPTPRTGTFANVDFGLLVDGAYVFQATATDRAGNRSAPTVVNFVLDRIVPAAPTLTSQAAEIVQSPRAYFSWTGEAGAQFSWTVFQGALAVQGPRTTPDGTVITDPLVDGSYAFQVVQTDAAGNRSAPTTSKPFRIATPRAPTRLTTVGKPRPSVKVDGIGRQPRVRPFGLLRPTAGTRLTPAGRLLTWRVRYGPPASVYNLQVFDQNRRKLISAFPSTQQQRLPARFGKPGMRYYWQVWGFVPGKGYGRIPIGLSYFDVPKK